MARHYRFFIHISSVLMLFPAFFIFSGIALADDPLFTVHGVRVDVTAESAVAARTQAFEQAQQDAFKMLAERLLPEEEAQDFALPPSTVISPMVKDFEITGEQLSRVRYIGTYTFRFKDQAIRQFFAGRNVSFSAIRSKPVLILPFYQIGTKVTLWGDANPWLAAWGRTDTRQGLVPVQIPIGDIADVGDIGDTQALTYNSGNLHSMINRYGAGEAIIVVAQPRGDSPPLGSEPASIDVMIYRTDTGAPAFVKTVSVTRADKTGEETIFDTAVRLTRKTFQSDWKNKTSVQMGEKSALKARVRFGSLREWSETQKALRTVSSISYMRVVRLSPRQAEIELTYSGSEDRLRLALSQANIALSEPQPSYGSDNGYEMAAPVYDLYLTQDPLPTHGMSE